MARPKMNGTYLNVCIETSIYNIICWKHYAGMQVRLKLLQLREH